MVVILVKRALEAEVGPKIERWPELLRVRRCCVGLINCSIELFGDKDRLEAPMESGS